MTDPSMPVSSLRTGADSARRLMEAAVDAFAHKGFYATSTRDIAARANMSAAGVYVHFASKEDLFFQLCRDGHVQALEIVTSARESAQTPPAQLIRSFRPSPAGMRSSSRQHGSCSTSSPI